MFLFCFVLGGVLHRFNIKEYGLIRELSSYSRPHFTHAQFFASHAHFLRVHLTAAVRCIVYYGMGRVTGDNSLLYEFYLLAARWTVHAKIDN